jgi:hypothetical protein
MTSKTILFLPSNGNHVKIFLPIVNVIKKKYNFIFFTQGTYKDEGAEKELNCLNIPYKTLDEYPKLVPNQIFEQENVGLIIVGNDSDVIPQWFINSGKKKQISSILIQDGLLLDVIPLNNNFFNQISFFKNIKSKKLFQLSLKLKFTKQIKKISYGQAGCTEIHVWTDSDKKFLLKKKIPQNSIHVTGNLKFTNFKKSNYGIVNPNSFVLYASTDLIHTKILPKKKVIAIVDDVCRTVSLLSKTKLIIKPHPIEDKQFYQNFKQNYNSVVEITDQNIDILIDKSNFLITNLSAVVFDALYLQKPVIIYLPEIEKIVDNSSFPLNLIRKNILYYAKNQKELLEKIKILEDNSFRFSSSQLDLITENLGKKDDSILKIANSINVLMK